MGRHVVGPNEMQYFLDSMEITMASDSKAEKRLSYTIITRQPLHMKGPLLHKLEFCVAAPGFLKTFVSLAKAVEAYNDI